MSRIDSLFKSLKSYTWTTIPHLKSMKRFVQTGDLTELAKVGVLQDELCFWVDELRKAISPPKRLDDYDRRLFQLLIAMGNANLVGEWVQQHMASGRGDECVAEILWKELSALGVTTQTIGLTLAGGVRTWVRGGEPTSAGRVILAMSDRDLQATVVGAAPTASLHELAELLFLHAPERVPPLVETFLTPCGWISNREVSPAACATLLKYGEGRFEGAILQALEGIKEPWHQFHVACTLVDHDINRFGALGLKVARSAVAAPCMESNHDVVFEWMIDKFGAVVVPDVLAYLSRADAHFWWSLNTLKVAVRTLGEQATPAVELGLTHRHPNVKLVAVELALHDRRPEMMARVLDALKEGLAARQGENLVQFISLVGRWRPSQCLDELWSLCGDRRKTVRDASARAIGRVGPSVVARAGEQLGARKKADRLTALLILTTVNSREASTLIDDALEREKNDDVRDEMLLALETSWEQQGRTLGSDEIKKRVETAATKIDGLPVDWLLESKLPQLWYEDGKEVEPEVVRYLLYRQSRCKEIRPDVEAKHLYRLLDRDRSGDFALHVLHRYLTSGVDAKDRWALALAGLLGDDRVVPALARQVRQWPTCQRGKLAEYGVQALSLLGSDEALTAIDATALRFRTKYKNVGQAAVTAFNSVAEAKGFSPEELGDRVVPWLGFERGAPQIIEAGKRRIEVCVGGDFKLRYLDLVKNKALKSLPKAAGPERKAEMKELGASLREVVKAQVLRLESLLVRQYRWPAARWKELYLDHPVLRPFAVRLVWGTFDGSGELQQTFRALEDSSLTDVEDDPFELPGADVRVGIVHPLDLDPDLTNAWIGHQADYDLVSPFPLLERAVHRPAPDEKDRKFFREVSGQQVNAMTFHGRATRAGWGRGDVVDAGMVSTYMKRFPGAGVDAFVFLDGMFIGVDMYDSITVGDAFFAKTGSVCTSGYAYDEPQDEKDVRLIPFKDVPAVVYSEVVADLQRFAPASHE